MDTTPQKIKVFEINTSFAYAGAQRTMLSFCAYLRKDLFDIWAISYGDGGPRQKEFEALGIPTVVAGGEIKKIITLAVEKEPHVIHIHRSGGPNPIERELLLQLRVCLPHAAIVETNVFGQYDAVTASVIDVHLLKSKMMLTERFVPASGGVFDKEKMHVIYNPVNHKLFNQFRCSSEEIQAYRESLHIPKSHHVIGRIGRPDITKWSDLLFEMLPLLIKEFPTVTCLIQDLPPSRQAWLERAPWKEHVRVIPQTADEKEVHRFYQTIDILTHTSKIGEAFGNTLNEAMYWGKPVVTHSTPMKDNGQIEQVDHGVNGLIANTPEDMAGATSTLLKDSALRERFGANGHAKVTTVYDPRTVTLQLEKVFLEIVKKKGYSVPHEMGKDAEAVSWSPSPEAIIAYEEEYQERLRNVFRDTTIPRSFLRNVRQIFRRVLWRVYDVMVARQVPVLRSSRIAQLIARLGL